MKRKAIRYGFAGLTGLALSGAILSGTRHAPARADASNYTNQRRQIRACVLVSGAAQDAGANNLLAPSNTQPYVFYAMDKGNDLKPAGFEFINPLAPGIITPAIYNRWLSRIPNGQTDRAFANGSQESIVFQVNQPVTKNMGAYWEMNLDTMSAATLQQYDVVYIPLHGSRNPLATQPLVQFTPTEREMLRHYVDAGGTVWLENAGEGANAFIPTNTTPTPPGDSFFEWLNTKAGPGANTPVSVLSAHHPLVNYPYQINQQDAYSLGLYAPSNAVFVGSPVQGGARPLDVAALPIISKNGQPTVWASDYGAGHVLVTSASIGGDINNYQIANNAGSSVVGVNDGAITGDNLGNIPAADMKLAYNLVSWISAVPAPGSNQRRTGSTQETIGSTLTPKWSPIPITPLNPIEPATIATGNPGSGATIYKGMAFWVDGNNWFHAYNVNPGLSLNNNNNLDAGIPDQAVGASYDQVWTDSGQVLGDPTTDRVSTPTLISQYDSTAGSTYEVAVVSTTTGGTFFYNAFPIANGQLAGASQTPIAALKSGGDMKPALNPNGGNGGTPTPSAGLPYGQNSPKPVPAPAYSDGVLFTIVFNNALGPSGELGWRIAPVDMLGSLRAKSPVSIFDNTQPPVPTNGSAKGYGLAPSASFNGMGLPGYNTPSGSLTVGEVQSTESDAIDRMVYVPIAADLGAQPTGAAGAVRGVWFSSRNDTLNQDLTADPTGATFKLNGRRARVPWYTSTGASTTINLMPVVHVVRHASQADPTITGMNTYNYPGDFDVTYTQEASNNSNGFTPNANSHNTHVVFHTGITLPNTYDDVRVDYTVDWPGDSVGNVSATTPSQEDMNIIATQHDFALITPGPQQMMSETTGGVTLSSLDNILYTITNLHDLSGGAGGASTPAVEDRVVSGRDQYASLAVGTRPRAGRASATINWTFAPAPGRQFDSGYAGGKFGGYQSQPRLTYHGAPIYNFKAVGPPITHNGTVYVVGMGFNSPPGTGAQTPAYTVILALRENIDATIDLGAQNVTNLNALKLVQPSLLDPQNPITLTASTDNGGGSFTVEPVQDPVSGGTKYIAHILNFQPEGNRDAFNTALPVWVDTGATGQNTYGQPIVNGATTFGPLDNLQSYIVIPTGTNGSDSNGNLLRAGITPTSGPSISGNTLYFAADIGFRSGGTVPSTIVSVDLLRSSGIQGDYLDAAKNFVVTVPQNNVFMDITSHNELSTIMPSVHPPLGTTNVILAANAQNLVGMDNGLILIADSHRLLEVDAGGNASWSLESTVSQSLVGGPTLATGGQALTAIPLRNPSTATRYSLNEFVIADTTNNRIVSANRGATTRYEIAGFRDDIKFLLPGDPITLNAPTDVQTFVETYPTGYSVFNRDTKVTYTYANPCSVYHYLIADGGNYRIVDVADIYDSNTGGIATLAGSDGSAAQGSKLLIFLSRSLGEQNQRLRYRTIQQFRQDGYDYIISCVSNVRQANTGGAGVLGNDNTNFEGPGGSIMAIQRTANDPANPTGQVGDTVRIVNSIIVQNPDNTLRRQPISNPTWFKEFGAFDPQAPNANGGKITPHFLMADANGCYILKIASVTLNGQTTTEYVTDWMLSNQDYYFLTGRKLQAACIQRESLSDISDRNLFEPRLLITNSYTGADDLTKLFNINSQSPVSGEVFEIKASDYYPSKALNKNYYGYQLGVLARYTTAGAFGDPTKVSITRMIPTEYFQNGTLRRGIGSADNSLTTYSLQKPLYAERPF